MPSGITLGNAPWLVELYFQAKTNPRYSLQRSPEYTRLFCVAVERELAELSDFDRTLLEMRAQGYTRSEMADVVGWSARSIGRAFDRMATAGPQ
jgi:hypothetical protein